MLRTTNQRSQSNQQEAQTRGHHIAHAGQALGKAMKQLEAGLPSSPRKQRFVVKKPARSVGVSTSVLVIQKEYTSRKQRKKTIGAFFLQDRQHVVESTRKKISLMKQQRRETGLRQLSKFAT